MNFIKTTLLLVVMAILLIFIGGLLGGPRGAMLAFIFALLLNGISYWYSDKIVLAMYRAKELPADEYPEIHEMISELSQNAGIPYPRVYYNSLEVPNAFATGRDPENAVVCVTAGAMKLLDKNELRAVISHEIGHIRNRDTLTMTVTAALASAIMMLAYMARWGAILGGFSRDRDDSGNIIALIAISIVGPLAALLVQMAISRSREYAADAFGAKISNDPNSLARALEDLSTYSKRTKLQGPPQTSHLFIVNPFTGGFIANLFSTHPPVEERVRRLRSMA